MNEIIYELIGAFIGGGLLTFAGFKLYIHFHLKKNFIKKETIRTKLSKKSKQRGLFNRDFTWSTGKGAKNDVTVTLTMEFTVIDESADMIKVKVDDIKMNNWSYSDKSCMDSYYRSFSNKWIDRNDKKLHLLKETPENIRAKKLSEILD